MDPAPPITGVSEIVLSAADLPQMREFYVNVLGFPVHSELSMEAAEPDPDGEPTITFLTITDTGSPLSQGGHPQMLALIDYRRHIYAKRRLTGHDINSSTLNHLAFEIPPESYDAHLARLRKLELEPTEAEFPAVQAKAIFFADPEGNRLELICSAK